MERMGNGQTAALCPKGDAPGYETAKRIMDVLISSFLLVLLLPVMLFVAFVILVDDPGVGPIFTQTRVGQKGKPFTLYKFRTMYPGADREKHLLLSRSEMEGPVFKMRDDPRVTPVGRFLRRSSLDELPQLWNVLLGDMSLVGPRPGLPEEINKYDDISLLRLQIQPGITCLWQIRQDRYELPFRDWVALDLCYIRERNLWLDLQILLATVAAVLRMNGR